MSEEHLNEHPEDKPEDKPLVPLTQTLGFGAGTMLAAGIVDLVAHLGPTGLVVGGIAAYVVSQHGPDLASRVREALPSPAPLATKQTGKAYTPRRNGGRSLLDRALGRFPAEEDDHATVVVDEAEKDHETRFDQPITAPVFPIYPANKTLRLGTVGGTRQRFDPPMNALLGKGGLLAGSQGTGKSNILGLVAYSAGQCGMPLTVIDFKGEFWPLREVVPNGILAGHPSYAEMAGPGFFPLSADNAAVLAAAVMEGPFQLVVDVPSYNGDGDEVAQAIAALLHGLMDWSFKLRRGGKEPWPCLVVTDEAHNFLPERQRLSGLAMKRPAESFGALTSAYARMANTGRSFGYTLVMATLRLPNIAKWSIANLQVKVVLAHTERNDLDACEEETGGLVDREEIKRLEQGTGIVLGLTKEPVLVHFDKQSARHVSDTPPVERVHETFQHAPRPSLSPILAQRIPGTDRYERVDRPLPAGEPSAYMLRRLPFPEQQAFPQQQWAATPSPFLREVRREEAAEHLPNLGQDVVPPVPPVPRSLRHHQEKYAKAIAVWHELEDKQSANMRDFAAAMNLNEAKAYKLLCEMERLQLIHWERKKKKTI